MSFKQQNSQLKNILTKRDINEINYSKTVLKGDLRVLTEEIQSVESFALGITVGSGSRDDLQDKSGTAHLLEHTAFRQSKKHSSKEIAERFENIGAYCNAFTTKENISFYVRALKNNLKKSLNLLSELVCEPVFKKNDCQKERLIILEEIKSSEDDPEEYIFDLAEKIIFDGNTLSEPIMGSQESILNISEDDVKDYYNLNFTKSNTIISCAGNISHDEISDLIDSNFKFYNIAIKSPRTNNVVKNNCKKIELHKSFQQSHILAAIHVKGHYAEEKYALSLLNIIFGDGMSSRLNQRLREKHSLAYNIYSSAQIYRDNGGFFIYAACENNKIKKIENLIFLEIEKLLSGGISDTEYSRAREQLKSSLIMSLESMTSRMESLAKNEFYSGEYESVNTMIDIIDSISKDEIMKLVTQYFHLENWTTIIFHGAKS